MLRAALPSYAMSHATGSRAVSATADFEALARELHASDICMGLQAAVYSMMVWITHRNAGHDFLIRFDRKAALGIWTRRPANGSMPWL